MTYNECIQCGWVGTKAVRHYHDSGHSQFGGRTETGHGDDVAGFRRLLHSWAAAELSKRTRHQGPFRILRVSIHTSPGSSYESDSLEVGIYFDHPATCCNDRVGWYERPDDVANMLNGILRLGDEHD